MEAFLYITCDMKAIMRGICPRVSLCVVICSLLSFQPCRGDLAAVRKIVNTIMASGMTEFTDYVTRRFHGCSCSPEASKEDCFTKEDVVAALKKFVPTSESEFGVFFADLEDIREERLEGSAHTLG